MKKLFSIVCVILFSISSIFAAKQYKDSIVVATDGTGDYCSLSEAMEGIRAFMDYKVTVFIKKGVYKEKVIVPAWLQNVDFIGEDAETTVITYDDHANIDNMGTFRTYTLKVEGTMLTFRNLTIENNAAQLGQAVALHTEGDKLRFFNCRFLGNQDTVYTGRANSRLYFSNCYIEGTTDFIFGPATALFVGCIIHSKKDSYITAASTPADVRVGYVFKNCRLTADSNVTKVYLGRPWRPYASTVFIGCEMGRHICPAGWDNWRNPDNENTARYAEYNNSGEGASTSGRVSWSVKLKKSEAVVYDDISYIYSISDSWNPYY
ncbi:pectinesterase family protein [Bacteroides caecigallinarum]|uniref:pectinesterase family protein n=1 Tax=Bacteroides caecigallinarum TaxID=1411144 RepID=UPI00195DA3DB|nr:pectinesterase family protein [Bacteroides caecigallinarum]MBM6890710.1 pectin esterase [Bacteroides caecigallinarum]MCF2551544.1 pectin esterase [Bacteroides caecigallinarum]